MFKEIYKLGELTLFDNYKKIKENCMNYVIYYGNAH